MTTTALTKPATKHFVRHAIEMAVAMWVGMALLDPLWAALLGNALDRPDVAAFVAATDMTIAMSVWMAYRGHNRAQLVEMGAAMYVPYLVLLVPYWLGALPGEHVVMGGHALMLPAMAIAMFARRAEYSAHHGQTTNPLIGVLGKRAATWIALAMTLDNWHTPSVPAPWTLLLLPGAYLLFGAIRGQLRDRRQLVIQLAGTVGYILLMAVAATSGPTTAAVLVAAGFGAHAVWDYVHHRLDVVAPRWWAEWCGVVDAVIAGTVLLFWL